MQFKNLAALIAVAATAVHANSHANNKHDAAPRSPVDANAGVAVNVTGITSSLVTLLSGLGQLGEEGSGIVGNLIKGLLEGGGHALNETSSGIADVLGESPAIAEALHNILGTIEICAS